jgi:hypothetical protein
MATAERMGYSPNHDVTHHKPTGIDECEWLADAALVERLYQRARAHFPPEIDGNAVAGINARWRLFRYAPGEKVWG